MSGGGTCSGANQHVTAVTVSGNTATVTHNGDTIKTAYLRITGGTT